MATLRIVAQVPASSGTVYLTGSLPELGPWKPDALAMQGSGTEREATLRVPRGTPVEFKFTRGTWDNEAVTEDGSTPPNNQVEVKDDVTVSVAVAKFRMSYREEFASEFEPLPYEDVPLAILSPRDWQVIQRETPERGRVLVSGRVRGGYETVRVEVKSPEGAPLIGPIDVVADAASGAFQTRLDLPAGGWYRVEMQARDSGGSESPLAIVPHVGVGEVFVSAGQSNSTNCGQFRTRQQSGMVSAFSGTYWRLANDPLPGAHDNCVGGSVWPAFGDDLYARYGVPIGVAVTGTAGSSVTQWERGGDLYAWMMTRIYQLGPGGFRAILWHQGEADWNLTAREYFERMQSLIRESRLDAGWEIPWMTAHASYHNADHPSWPAVREAQQRLWDEGISLQGPDTDTLTGENRDLGGLGIHFSPVGLKAHGLMWAERVATWLEGGPLARAKP